MRNNLIFTGEPKAENESPETMESILREHLNDALKNAQETAVTNTFNRVHQSPGNIHVGKFALTRLRGFIDRRRNMHVGKFALSLYLFQGLGDSATPVKTYKWYRI